jgi:hypothetical protein
MEREMSDEGVIIHLFFHLGSPKVGGHFGRVNTWCTRYIHVSTHVSKTMGWWRSQHGTCNVHRLPTHPKHLGGQEQQAKQCKQKWSESQAKLEQRGSEVGMQGGHPLPDLMDLMDV